MDARRLVGMTQGARKRAARCATAATDYNADPDGPLWALIMTDAPGRAFPRDRRAARRAFHESAESLYADGRPYAKQRAAYRIGERLQLCSCTWRWNRKSNQRPLLPSRYCEECMGTGVLPARKAKP